MAKRQQHEGGFLPFDLENLEPDPAVSALVSRGQAAQAERRLPVKDRKKKARQREKDKAREGKRALYDLPKETLERIQKIAKWHGTTASGVAGLALARLIDDIETGKINLRDYLEPIDSPRYTFRVCLKKRK